MGRENRKLNKRDKRKGKVDDKGGIDNMVFVRNPRPPFDLINITTDTTKYARRTIVNGEAEK